MSESRRAGISVEYEGKNITSQIKEYILSATYTDVASGESDSISLNLEDRDKKFIDAWRPEKEDHMKLTIITKNWDKERENRNFQCGSFLLDDLSTQGPPITVTIGAVSVPQNGDFRSRETTKTWQNVSLNKIASDIASEAGIGLIFDAADIAIESIEQNGKTNCDFLYGLVKSYGYSMKVYADRIIIYDTESYEKRESVTEINIKEAVSWNHNETIQGSYTGATISFSDPNTEKDQIIHVGSEGRIYEINKTADGVRDAELKGMAALNLENRKTTTMSMTIMARPGLSSSACVDITGFGKMNGKYFIDKIKHTISGNGGYKMALTMHKVIDWIKSSSVEAVQAASAAAAASTQYVIKAGDSLWSLAQTNYGSGAEYMRIYNDNSEVIESTAKSHGKETSENGHWIWTGEVIVINK